MQKHGFAVHQMAVRDAVSDAFQCGGHPARLSACCPCRVKFSTEHAPKAVFLCFCLLTAVCSIRVFEFKCMFY